MLLFILPAVVVYILFDPGLGSVDVDTGTAREVLLINMPHGVCFGRVLPAPSSTSLSRSATHRTFRQPRRCSTALQLEGTEQPTELTCAISGPTSSLCTVSVCHEPRGMSSRVTRDDLFLPRHYSVPSGSGCETARSVLFASKDDLLLLFSREIHQGSAPNQLPSAEPSRGMRSIGLTNRM